MPGSALVTSLKVLSAAGSLAAVIKLFWTGLFRRYRFFCAYLLFRIAYISLALVVDFRSKLYLHIFLIAEPITWILFALTLAELYGVILEKYRGLHTLGRWAMYLATAVAVLVSILSLLPKIQPSTGSAGRLLDYALAAERGIYLSLATFLIIILLFLTRYPVPLSRNAIVHAAVFSVYFISNTLIFLARSLFGVRFNETASSFLLGVSTLCIYAWLAFLSRGGEQTRVRLPILGAQHEERILRQLDAINATLLRISRDSQFDN